MNATALPPRWKAVAQLVRLPNVFTAAADSLAGWIVAGGGLVEPARWWPLPLASMAIYAAGMALNDLCDLEVDRRERPARPLPSGAVSPRLAARLVLTLLAAALALLGATGSPRSFAPAACLIACVVAYDLALRRTPLGPVAMGACRGLNLSLGLSVAPDFGGWPAWLGATAFGVFVAGITCMSRSEVQGGRNRWLRAGRLAQVLACAALVLPLWALATGSRVAGAMLGLAAGVVILLVVAARVQHHGALAWADPSPARLQAAVRAGIFSLIFLDTALAAAAAAPWAFLVAACWLPARLAGKWLYST